MALAQLVQLPPVTTGLFCDNSMDRQSSLDNFKHLQSAKSNLAALISLIHTKVISSNMGRKIARSGLRNHHIQLAFERAGGDGITALLSESLDSVVRVTKCKNIIDSIVLHFQTPQTLDALLFHV